MDGTWQRPPRLTAASPTARRTSWPPRGTDAPPDADFVARWSRWPLRREWLAERLAERGVGHDRAVAADDPLHVEAVRADRLLERLRARADRRDALDQRAARRDGPRRELGRGA